MSIINKTDIEDFLQIEIDPCFDDQVARWIQAAISHAENVIDRKIMLDDVSSDRLYDGENNPKIIIDDCREIEEVADCDNVLATTEYLAWPYNSPIKTHINLKSGKWSSGFASVRVKAKWGCYTELDIPEDLRFAILVLAAGIVNSNQNNSGTVDNQVVQSESIGRYSVTYRDTTQKMEFQNAKETLLAYKRYSI